MPAAPSELLLLIAPELAAIPEPQREAAIGMAELQTGEVFGVLRNQAVAYLAAHLLTISQRGGSSQEIVSRKEGDLAETFSTHTSTTGQSGSGLEATSYGMERLRLRRMAVVGATISS